MIQTPERRALLRKYAEHCLYFLERAFNYSVETGYDFGGLCTEENLHDILYGYWESRAYQFFDVQNVRLPYIDHIYTRDCPVPHTHGDISVFNNLTAENPAVRNPEVPRAEFERIQGIYARYDSYLNYRHNIFDDYAASGMSSGEYYFEAHMVQTFRVLFFHLELLARDIRTDADDINEGARFDSIVPRELREICHNDTAYREYVLARRDYELRIGDIENIHVKNLAYNSRPREDDLILLFWTRIKNQNRTSTTTGTTTSTTIEATSTTIKFEESKNGKGKFFKTLAGKCLRLSSQYKTNSDGTSQNCHSQDKHGQKSCNIYRQLRQSKKMSHEYLNDFIHSENPYNRVNSTDETIRFVKIFKNELAVFVNLYYAAA